MVTLTRVRASWVPAGNDDISHDVAKALDVLLKRNIRLQVAAEIAAVAAAAAAAAEKAAAAKKAADEKAAAARKAADEKAAAEKAEAEKKAAAAKKAADEKAAAAKAAADKAAAEKAAAEKAATEARVLELENQLAAALATAREWNKVAEKAENEKAAAEKAAAEKAEKEKAEREKAAAATDARILDLEKQLAASLAMAKAITESFWWPWKQEAAQTPMAPEKAPPSERLTSRLTSERVRLQKNAPNPMGAPDPMAAAELFWKTRYRFSVPHVITEQMTNHIKSIVRSRLLMGVSFEDVYPKVVLSYASGRRPQDCEGAGPGMFYAADFLEFLHERHVPAFSGLHVPPGKDWRCYMLRLVGRKAQAKVLVVLLTAALFESKPCLQEINAAVENDIPLLPSASLALPIPDPSGPCALPCALAADHGSAPVPAVRFEAKLPDKKNQWPQLTDEASEVMISRVQQTLGKANDFPNPGTMLTMSSALDDVLGMIKHIVDTHATRTDTQDADTHYRGYSG